MRKLLTAFLLATLAGCATHGKSDEQITTEAIKAQAAMLPPGQKPAELISTKIFSHGLIGDNLAIAAGGGANVQLLRQELLQVKSMGNTAFLIIGSSTALDVTIIKNAVDPIDLSGVSVFYAGSADQKDAVRAALEKSHAKFHYIDTH